MNEEMNVMVNENEMDNNIGETAVAVNEDVVETVEPKNGLAVAGGIIAGAGAIVATVVGGFKLVKHFKKVAELKKNGQYESTVEAKKLAKKNRQAIAMMSDEEINMLMNVNNMIAKEEGNKEVNNEETNANAVEQTA